MRARTKLAGAALLAAFAAAIAFPGPARGEPPTPSSHVVVAASADDWISVADASGHVILGRLLHQGDKLALPNGSGLVFTAGNAGATTLLVDGSPAPPLGSGGQVVSNQPINAALIAAGRLPAQIAEARIAQAQIAAPAVPKNATKNSEKPQNEASGQPAPKVAAVATPKPEPAPVPDTNASKASRIVVAASADDWISVTDASGHVILARLLHQGDKLALPEGSGLVFTTGNAGATTLLVDGREAPALGGEGQVVSNQPLDPALIAAGHLPAQLAKVRTAPLPSDRPTADAKAARRAPALLRPVAMIVPVQQSAPAEAPPPAAKPIIPPKVAPLRPAGVQRSGPGAVLTPGGLAGPAMAVTQPAAPTHLDPRSLGATIALRSGSGQVVNLSVAAASVFTADPKIADVRPASPTSLFVLGVAPGETTIAALDQAGHPIAQYRVNVPPSAFGPDAAAAAISRLLPGAEVRLSALPDGLTVAGTVATPADAAEIMALVKGFLGPKEVAHDELSVLSDVQVSLQVRVAEMSRTITRELGVNWQELGTTGGKISANFMAPPALAFLNDAANTFNLTYHSGNTNVNSIIDALAQDQLARLLAEPNLTAMSGQTASFLVGGEFPIPVALQNGEISVQFQPYGVSLSFVPTVLADNRISIRVRPEVSELTNQGAVQLSEGNSTIQI
ncbi:MAG: RodZ domain-containing protein, partial [Acetobacteraceae bacterium]